MRFNQKKLTKKAKAMIRSDVVGAVALVSVLINVFFFSGIMLFATTNQLDASLYEASLTNLCNKNYTENLMEEMAHAEDPDLARANFEVVCRSGDFERYYENAKKAYENDTL